MRLIDSWKQGQEFYAETFYPNDDCSEIMNFGIVQQHIHNSFPVYDKYNTSQGSMQ